MDSSDPGAPDDDILKPRDHRVPVVDRFQNTRQPDWDWWGRLWPTPGETLRLLGLGPDTSLVEVGSGNGYFALPAARVVEPAPVYAIDLDGGLLAELARLAALQGIENVHPIRGDARGLSRYLAEPVDVCLLANTFHGVEEPGPLVAGVYRSLAAGGSFVVVNWHDRPREETTLDGEPRGPPPSLRLSPSATERRVTEAADFTLVRELDLPPYHYGLVFER